MTMFGLRKRVERAAARVPLAPPDPLPSWWRKEPEDMSDVELAEAIAWYDAQVGGDLSALTDDELEEALADQERAWT